MVLSQISELFFLQLASGITFAVLCIRSEALGRGFYVLNTVLAVVAVAISLTFAVFQVGREEIFLWPGVSTAGALLILGAILQARQNRYWVWPVFLAFLASGFALCALSRMLAPAALKVPSLDQLLRVTSTFLGGFLVGGALVVMNLGHWYLVAKGLSFDLLEQAARGFLVIVFTRMLLLAVTLAMFYFTAEVGVLVFEQLLAPDGFLIFFLMRCLWGLLGPLVLGVLVLRCVQIRSNTSATGLMYVVVVFALIGELLASYLTVLTAVPV